MRLIALVLLPCRARRVNRRHAQTIKEPREAGCRGRPPGSVDFYRAGDYPARESSLRPHTNSPKPPDLLHNPSLTAEARPLR